MAATGTTKLTQSQSTTTSFTPSFRRLLPRWIGMIPQSHIKLIFQIHYNLQLNDDFIKTNNSFSVWNLMENIRTQALLTPLTEGTVGIQIAVQ